VTDPRARRPPFDARHVQNCFLFAATFGPALEVHQAPFQPGYLGLFVQTKRPQRKSHLHLLLRLRMSAAISTLQPYLHCLTSLPDAGLKQASYNYNRFDHQSRTSTVIWSQAPQPARPSVRLHKTSPPCLTPSKRGTRTAMLRD